jgi:cytochrome c peroxidase
MHYFKLSTGMFAAFALLCCQTGCSPSSPQVDEKKSAVEEKSAAAEAPPESLEAVAVATGEKEELASASEEKISETLQPTESEATTSTSTEEPKKAEPAATEPTASKSTEADTPAKVAAESAAPVEVLLGTAELTSGIPGQGPLTIERIQTWLDDPANHQTLAVKLPLGLSAGQASIVGLDKNPLTKAKIELGRELFFDRRLSADATVSCADCHHPETGFARATQFGVGIGSQTGNRNSPASYNRILSGPQFWDGRAMSLEEQAKGPIANPIEMGNTHEVCNRTIGEIPGYKIQFEKIYPDGVNIENIANAIAAFERVVVTNPSPYDYYEPLRNFENAFRDDLEDLESLQEDDPDIYEQYLALKKASDAHPISDSAKRGREIFFSDKGKCTACHVGANFSDEKYHNLGVGMDADEPDLGRFVVTGEEKDRGAFKTPTIRNVELTAPYMHDGSLKTLEEVVEWYAKGGHPNPHLSENIKKLDLTAQDKKDLVAFMKACTGEFTPVETGELPVGKVAEAEKSE